MQRDHCSFRVAGGAAERACGVGKDRQAFNVDQAFADSFIAFTSDPDAEFDRRRDLSEIVCACRIQRFQRNQIVDVLLIWYSPLPESTRRKSASADPR